MTFQLECTGKISYFYSMQYWSKSKHWCFWNEHRALHVCGRRSCTHCHTLCRMSARVIAWLRPAGMCQAPLASAPRVLQDLCAESLPSAGPIGNRGKIPSIFPIPAQNSGRFIGQIGAGRGGNPALSRGFRGLGTSESESELTVTGQLRALCYYVGLGILGSIRIY